MSQLYEKYGEFGSASEIAEAIKAQFDEGDTEAAFEIGRENGLEDDDILDIADGVPVEEVLTPCVVALGKIQIEAEAYQKNDSIIVDWIEYIKALAIDSEEIAKNIRKKGKSLNGCLGELLKFSYNHAFSIPGDIVSLRNMSE